MSRSKPKRASPWLILSALCFSALIALIVFCATLTGATDSVVPAPRGQPTDIKVTPAEEEEYPYPTVDWEYWLSVNPDVIGWVTIPGTSVDYAIVQAPDYDPTFYLTHDIYKNWNIYGCPYVDSDCDGFEGAVTYIFGHHMTYGNPMFADFASYSNAAFAQEYALILLQTPEDRIPLRVSAADIVSGYEKSRRTAFAGTDEVRTWYEERFAMADMQMQNDTEAEQLFIYVTCSYNYFSNERTLVYSQSLNERNTL